MLNRRLALAAILVSAMPLLATETQRYLVSTRTAPTRMRIVTDDAAAVAHRVRKFENIRAFAADLTDAEVAQLRRSPDVAYIEPVVERVALEVPPLGASVGTQASPYATQVVPWGITAVRATEAWTATRGETVNVAVVDTGVDPTHPDLVHAYAGGYNVFAPDSSPADDHKHGTHVAGTIAAADNHTGVVGVAPNVRIWAVKVLNRDGSGTNESVMAGIDWVIRKSREVGGRWIINMSLGSMSHSQAEAEICNRAINAGIVIVAASGNRASSTIGYPAGHKGVIAVGAVGDDLARAKFSNYGLGLSIMAPGVGVASTVIEGLAKVAEVTVEATAIPARGLSGSPFGLASEQLIDCGLGYPQNFPLAVRGRIALIKRGEIYFREKARNAKNAGASAVVIYDNTVADAPAQWTLCNAECEPEWEGYEFPLTMGVTKAAGEWLLTQRQPASVEFRPEIYDVFNGTSMATPHVAGVAALLLALDPEMNPAQVQFVLERTARDIGEPGRDTETASGLLDALAAAQYVAPQKFGLPTPPPSTAPRRRSSGG